MNFNPLAHERRDIGHDYSSEHYEHFNPLAHERRDEKSYDEAV